jgi:methylase of polypeptide subunit release factors
VSYLERSYRGIRVFYTPELDGGGAGYGQDYIPFVSKHLKRQGHVFEWCAGPGFIGFSLLAHGLCEHLSLADVNPEAVAACRHTVRENGLEDRVDVHLSDGLRDIPALAPWDLVVGNPPHSGTDDDIAEIQRPAIIYKDPGFRIHQDFYANVGRFLAPNGQLLIQENFRFSCVAMFKTMIERGGFAIVDTPACETPLRKYYYYLWCARRARPAPGSV